MMTVNTEPLSFIEGLDTGLKSTNGKFPHWLSDFRQDELNKFLQWGVPTTRDEEWKYTNLSPLTKHTYRLPGKGQLREADLFGKFCAPGELRIVFVNGIYSPALSQLAELPPGITVRTLEEALTQTAGIEQLLKHGDIQKESAFMALNKALAQTGIVVEIADNLILEKPLNIFHLASFENFDKMITTPRTLVRMGRSSQAWILENHLAFNNQLIYFADALTDIFLAENAVLHYGKAQAESINAYHIGATRVWLERNANFEGFSLVTGGAITRNDLHVSLDGEGANATLNGLYCVNGRQLVDNHTAVDHRLPNCISNQLYKGILNGASQGVFNGKIFVRPVAQGTNSYQLNKNLLLGKECRVDTKPQLEIFADDVKCTHGATIGQLNEDEIFYLQTRGVSRKEAVKMLSRAFVNDILDRIQNTQMIAKLNILLEPTFQALE